VLNRRFPLIGRPDLVMPVAVTVLDSSDGNVTWKAREFARRAALSGYAWRGWSRLKLIKGQAGKRPILPESPTKIEKDERGQAVEPVMVEYRLGVDALKAQTLERLATKDGEPGCCYFPREIEVHYLEQFFGETLVDGKWVRNGPNETLDLYGYAEAGRLLLGPDRAGIDWEQSPPEWARPISLSEGNDEGQDQAIAYIFSMFSSLNS
jgi:phage terminase large subunit GpA-like protein